MTWSLILRQRARLDILEAESWYEARDPESKTIFIEDVRAMMTTILDNPHLYQRVHGDVRRALLQRFPYKLFYKLEDNKIIVLRCLHPRRNPAIWPK